VKSEPSAYVTSLVRITTLNKGRRPRRRDKKGAKKEKGRKEGRAASRKDKTASQPFRGDRAGSMERDWGSSKTGSVRSIHIHLPARTYKNPRGLSTSGPRAATDATGALSSHREASGVFTSTVYGSEPAGLAINSLYLRALCVYICVCVCVCGCNTRVHKNTYIRRFVQ